MPRYNEPRKSKEQLALEALAKAQRQQQIERQKEARKQVEKKEEVRQEALLCTVEGKTEIAQLEAKTRSDLFTLFQSETKRVSKEEFQHVDAPDASATTAASEKQSYCTIQ